MSTMAINLLALEDGLVLLIITQLELKSIYRIIEQLPEPLLHFNTELIIVHRVVVQYMQELMDILEETSLIID